MADTIYVSISGGLVIEICYILDAGGHGYSFVFSVNIWGASWWGKLQEKQASYFQMLPKRFLCFVF